MQPTASRDIRAQQMIVETKQTGDDGYPLWAVLYGPIADRAGALPDWPIAQGIVDHGTAYRIARAYVWHADAIQNADALTHLMHTRPARMTDARWTILRARVDTLWDRASAIRDRRDAVTERAIAADGPRAIAFPLHDVAASIVA